MRTIPCPLYAAAAATPDAPAIIGTGGVTRYSDLDRRVSTTAARLREAGIESGERVALYLPKNESYVVLLLALIRAGCAAVPLSTRVPPASINELPQSIESRTLISDSEELLADGSGRTLRPEGVLAESWIADSDRLLQVPEIPRERSATLVFTSGSTGVPKAAVHTFGNHYFSARGSNTNIALGPDDRWLLSLPLYHVGGLSILFRCLLAGAAMVLPEDGVPVEKEIYRHGVTHVSLVATQLLRMLGGETSALGELEAVLLGGGAVPEALVREARVHGLPLHTSYGLTEMASQVSTTPPGAVAGKLYTSGRVLPHREVRISGDGEILVRGDTLFAGYVENGVVRRPLDAEGWFRTKDLGYFDAEGYLHVRGRKDNLFVSGGENVQPEEIEKVLERTEGVAQAVVVPVEDAEFGHRPVAFVRGSGGSPAAGYLVSELQKVLPRFKVPAAFYGWPEEIGESMKPDRTALRELASHGTARRLRE